MPKVQDLTFDFDRRRAEIMDQLWRDVKSAFIKLQRLDQLQQLLNEENPARAKPNRHQPQQLRAAEGPVRKRRGRPPKAQAAKPAPAAKIPVTAANVRQFIIDALVQIGDGETLTPRRLKVLALEAGFPEFFGRDNKDRLSHAINRVLRELLLQNQVRRKDIGSDLYYSLNRPKLTVTRRQER